MSKAINKEGNKNVHSNLILQRLPILLTDFAHLPIQPPLRARFEALRYAWPARETETEVVESVQVLQEPRDLGRVTRGNEGGVGGG